VYSVEIIMGQGLCEGLEVAGGARREPGAGVSQLPDNVIGGSVDPGTSDTTAFEFVGREIDQGSEDEGVGDSCRNMRMIWIYAYCRGGIGMWAWGVGSVGGM